MADDDYMYEEELEIIEDALTDVLFDYVAVQTDRHASEEAVIGSVVDAVKEIYRSAAY